MGKHRARAARPKPRIGRPSSGSPDSASISWRKARCSLAYAYYGFGSDPNSFALGFRIDPILAAINLAWG